MKKLEIFENEMGQRRLDDDTRKAYLSWAKRFSRFCRGKTFETPEAAVSAFLGEFEKVGLSASSQKSALNALAGKNGLYACLGKPLGKLPEWVRPPESTWVPVWLTAAEVEALAVHLDEDWALICRLMFGAGLRICEVVALRWRDLDYERGTITVKQSKGGKDRVTFLPKTLMPQLRLRMERVRGIWKQDRDRGRPGVEIPESLANKVPRCGESFGMFWVFPAAGESVDPKSKIQRRHHLHKGSANRAIRIAALRSGITKRPTAHAFRHGFATAYLLAGGLLPELRDLLGHASIKTTEIYVHCLPSFVDRVGSPLDQAAPVIPFRAVGEVSRDRRKA